MTKTKIRASSILKITTGQKVLLAVALLAGFGAVAAGFASLPDGKCDGKGCVDGKGKTTSQPSSDQKTIQKTNQAAIPSKRLYPGMLIKSVGQSSVYYVASDFKLRSFPNQFTFSSWFDIDNATITLISQKQFDKLKIEGSVRSRPGMYLLKVSGKPDVYTATKGGILHRIPTEKVAEVYYGVKWNLKVMEISVKTFDTLYTVGDQATLKTTAFFPANALLETPTIDHDLGLK